MGWMEFDRWNTYVAMMALSEQAGLRAGDIHEAAIRYALGNRRRRAAFLLYIREGDRSGRAALQKTVDEQLAAFRAAKARGEPVLETVRAPGPVDSPTKRQRAKPVGPEAIRRFRERRAAEQAALGCGTDQVRGEA